MIARTPAAAMRSRSSVVRLVTWMWGSKKRIGSCSHGFEVLESDGARLARAGARQRRPHGRMALAGAELLQALSLPGTRQRQSGTAASGDVLVGGRELDLERREAALAAVLPEAQPQLVRHRPPCAAALVGEIERHARELARQPPVEPPEAPQRRADEQALDHALAPGEVVEVPRGVGRVEG